jgi:hypothetical protein
MVRPMGSTSDHGSFPRGATPTFLSVNTISERTGAIRRPDDLRRLTISGTALRSSFSARRYALANSGSLSCRAR